MKFGYKKKKPLFKDHDYTLVSNNEFEHMCYDLSKKVDGNRTKLN